MTETTAPMKPGPAAPEAPADARPTPAPPRTDAVREVPPAPAPAPGRDPRKAALLRFAVSITVLNVVGHLLLGFEQAPIVPIAAVLVAYACSLGLELVDSWARGVRPGYAGGPQEMFYFLLPAHIAALACAMLIYGQSLSIYLFAVVVAVGSKYLFRLRSGGRLRHYLNPSNFGICVTLLLMPAVGFVPPYMFLNRTDTFFDWLIPAVILVAGTLLNAKLTRRMPLIAAWVGGYVAQAVVRDVFLGDNVWSALGMMTGVAFVLFTNYMITDPGTTPFSPRRQVVFGLTTAAVYGVLIALGVAYAIFFGLVITCALRGVVLWTAERRRSRQSERERVAAPAGAAT
ncbi:enediyne biosynthesis protein UnbU [Isoptericola sp. b515]|uniref:enediyne biosynthesis protein UnbU n=1 Tax=Isoptericola sp. b515 TaxID=3064652 RepID=UPI0027130590|nr:enediyne biosynthesis protein UnbU [Isoptericola sp. b515]MDO8147756.1 enediyne biosynthesis protein UnbU [Isoptericola sp. b515]